METNNSNYKATVVRINNLRKHSNADRLLCTNIFGNNIIVGLETKEGDYGLYFPVESQLGEEFAKANDLIRRKDENGKAVGGMFDNNRRVRCQTFRGEKSMGFWIPINCLSYLGDPTDLVSENEEFTELCGEIICQKYIPKINPASNSGTGPKSKKPRESKIIDGQFHFHFDTSQLGKNIHKINITDLISVSWKFHGTSAIVSNCLVKRKLNWFEKLLMKFGLKIDSVHHEYIYASRRVVKNEFMEEKQHFYGYDLWSEIGKQHFENRLHKGETVYYEIVGYKKDGGYIQGPYDYGCKPQESKIYVYRITQTNSDGIVTELQWNQLKERCKEIGVEYCPEIFYGYARDIFTIDDVLSKNYQLDERGWNEDFLQLLKTKYAYDQDCQFCTNKVPSEGIVVRKEGLVIENFKLKNFRFLEHESKQLDTGEVDIETAETMVNEVIDSVNEKL